VRSLALLLLAAAAAADALPLVRELGARDPTRRDAARRALRAQGASALPAIVDGLGSPDAEIARACRELLLEAAHEAAPFLRASRRPEAKDLLEGLERKDCVRVTFLSVSPRDRKVQAAELFLRPGEAKRLEGAGTLPAAAAAIEEESVLVVLISLGEGRGLNVSPGEPLPELIELQDAAGDALVLAHIERCSVLDTQRAAGRDRVEEALARAVVAGRHRDAALAYVRATRSPSFYRRLHARFARGHVVYTTPLLLEGGADPVALARELPRGYEEAFALALPPGLSAESWRRLAGEVPAVLRRRDPLPALALRRVARQDPAAFHAELRRALEAGRVPMDAAYEAVVEDLQDAAWAGPAAATLELLDPLVDAARLAELKALHDSGRARARELGDFLKRRVGAP
jgi:hypothetical protein